MSPIAGPTIPETQTAATVPKLGGGVKFVHDYPVPKCGQNEVLAKVLYTGVCQSGTLNWLEAAALHSKTQLIHEWQIYIPRPGLPLGRTATR